MDKLLKILCLIFAIFFFGSALVQYNDPDRSLWIFIYLIATAISISAYFGRFDKLLLLTVLATAVFGALELFPYGHFEGVALKHGMKTIEIELARESLGFAFIIVAAVMYLLMSFRQSKSA